MPLLSLLGWLCRANADIGSFNTNSRPRWRSRFAVKVWACSPFPQFSFPQFSFPQFSFPQFSFPQFSYFHSLHFHSFPPHPDTGWLKIGGQGGMWALGKLSLWGLLRSIAPQEQKTSAEKCICFRHFLHPKTIIFLSQKRHQFFPPKPVSFSTNLH